MGPPPPGSVRNKHVTSLSSAIRSPPRADQYHFNWQNVAAGKISKHANKLSEMENLERNLENLRF